MKKISQAKRNASALRREANSHTGRNGNALISMEADLYGGGIEPLMPANLTFENLFRAYWGKKQGAERFEQARDLSESSEFFSTIIYLKEIFFNDGLNFGEQRRGYSGGNSKLATWLKKQTAAADEEKQYDFARVVNDAWREWLICDNIVAFWQENKLGRGSLPVVTILDCELCDYKNAFGAETLKIKVPKVTLDSDELNRLAGKGLDQRYLDAIKNGKSLTLDESKGERFRVLTREKLGRGLGTPRVGQVLNDLSVMDLFGIGNWSAASMMKDVIRQVVKGHQIKQGPLAGQAMHFIKKKDADNFKKALRNKRGAFDVFTNFDVEVKFPFIDPKYFDAKKFEGTLSRLENWAGPLGKLMLAGQQSPFLMDMFGTEGRRQRQLVADFLAGIFNDPSFLGEANNPPKDLIPQWNPRSFTIQKMLIELARFAYTDGLVSPQTAREWLDLDDKEEGDRLEQAGKKPKRFTPVFEAKQGMVAGSNKGGRPVESPTGTPAEAS
jgi:hypothetical protein